MGVFFIYSSARRCSVSAAVVVLLFLFISLSLSSVAWVAESHLAPFIACRLADCLTGGNHTHHTFALDLFLELFLFYYVSHFTFRSWLLLLYIRSGTRIAWALASYAEEMPCQDFLGWFSVSLALVNAFSCAWFVVVITCSSSFFGFINFMCVAVFGPMSKRVRENLIECIIRF